jgi:fatty-acyl-CoA synthase
MVMNEQGKAKGDAASNFRDGLARGALLFSLLIPAFFAYAALGSRFGLHDWRFGLGTLMREYGPILLIAGVCLGFVALGLSLLIKPRRGALSALVTILIPALGLGYAVYVQRQAAAIPPIHDVATDVLDPPTFSPEQLAARGPSANSVDLAANRIPAGWSNPAFADKATTDLIAEHYSDLTPLPIGLPPEEAFAIALRAAEAQGWTITASQEPSLSQEGRIEATATSFWFGFVDDIVVRVRATSDGAVIDARSTSRVGLSDLGANAARLRAFSEAVVAELTPRV